MPPTVRENPINGSMEILHPDLNKWVLAIAPLLVSGGFAVSLETAQAALLDAIKSNSEKLPTIDNKVQDLRTAVETLGLRVEQMDTLKLAQVVVLLTATQAATLTLRDDAEAIKTGLNGNKSVNELLASVDAKFVDYSTVLTAISTQIANVLTGIGAINTNLTGVQTLQSRGFATTPVISNLTLAAANTQYSFTFPAGTKKYAFKCRGDSSDTQANIRYAWVPAKVAPSTGAGAAVDSYNVLPAGAEEGSVDYFSSATPIYFSSDADGVVVAVRYWQ